MITSNMQKWSPYTNPSLITSLNYIPYMPGKHGQLWDSPSTSVGHVEVKIYRFFAPETLHHQPMPMRNNSKGLNSLAMSS